MPLSETIQYYVDRKFTTPAKASALTSEQCRNLESETVKNLIENGVIAFKKAIALTYTQRRTLESPAVTALVGKNIITLKKALGLTFEQREILESEAVKVLIEDGIITFKKALKLTLEQQKKLEFRALQTLIGNGTITFERAMSLRISECENLEFSREFIDNGFMSFEQALTLTEEQRKNLTSPTLRNSINHGIITFQQVLGLSPDQRIQNLESPVVRAFIANKIITLDQALGLRVRECRNLEIAKEFIDNGIITFNRALTLTQDECKNLISVAVKGQISNKNISFERALALTDKERENLESEAVIEFIANGTITFEQALELTDNQRYNLESVREFIADETITFERALALTINQRWNLDCSGVRELLANETITFERALTLTDNQRSNVESQTIREFIANDIITFEQAIALTIEERWKLHSKNIKELVIDKIIPFNVALALTSNTRENLGFDVIKKLIGDRIVTINQILILDSVLTHAERINLESETIRELMACNAITFRQALHLSNEQRKIFESDEIRKSIFEGRVSTSEVIITSLGRLSDTQLMNLESTFVRFLLDTDEITIHEALRLTPIQRENLDSPQIRRRLYKDLTRVHQVLSLTKRLTDTQLMNLESEVVNYLLDTEEMTIREALLLTPLQRVNLEFAEIRELIYTDVIIFDQVLDLREILTESQLLNLRTPTIQEFIDDRSITFRRALDLTADQRQYLESFSIRELIYNEVINVDQALGLTANAYRALQNPRTRERLRNGEITIADINIVAPMINDGQSTHTASVHKSVSESATRLANRYQSQINRLGLNKAVKKAKVYVESISNISEKNKAAKRGFLRITAPDYSFTDHGSQVTTRELTVFTFKAVHDDANRIGSLEDARAQWVEGLYEIQRGYNLSNAGIDDKDIDHPICAAGTFNKLIEKLQGIHPDCQIQFITKEIASLKLPIVVHEEAIEYLKNSANPKTAKELAEFTQLIHQIKEDGIEMIWDSIKGSVLERIFDEFGGLYEDRNDDSFVSLIDAGQYTALDEKEIVPFKLDIVVREEATRYLETFANPKTTKEAIESTQLIIKIKEKGIEVIWEDHIKNNVIDRLFDEFNSLYENKLDPGLISLVDTGKNIELGDLSDFEEQIKSSTGYQHYCHHKELEDSPRTAKRNSGEETSHYQTTSVSDILANSFWTEGSALNSNFEDQESEQQRVVDEPSAIVEYHH